jgi:hypothetical protein
MDILSITPSAHASFLATDFNENTPLSPEQDAIRLNREFAELLQRMWRFLAEEQESRAGTMDEFLKALNALKEINVTTGKDISADLYDVEIVLDSRSPASAGNKSMHTMKLWDLMITYGLCKEGDVKPSNHEALQVMIDHVDDRNTSISSIAQTAAIELKRIVNNRDQSMLMNGNIVTQLAKSLMAIIKLM